ncbi:hypothetical protein AQ616_15770 [Oceanobacillus sp. E9]|uniref:SRPBCC family protein n=1 Tax=Oceanobacillus kimchii TaxID=746691 RepID=A0ABQ5TEF3_9BACI|nr:MULTISPECIES: SRPBCC family protein [Oceanobacillus]OEH53930.1 hypothetical protein AQ616_15770 [Oceanobacillus sp. E9]GLO64442.1 hypothetical protein MACH08_02260 [Oceanobacillus kimchii]
MVRFSNTLTIASDAKEIFQYLANIENYTVWNYAVKEISKVDFKEGKVGSKYQLLRNMGLQSFEEIEIIECLPNENLTFEASGNIFSYTMMYELEQQSQGTLLINKVEMKSSAKNRIMIKMMQNNIKKSVNKNLHVLKNILEKRGVVLV